MKKITIITFMAALLWPSIAQAYGKYCYSSYGNSRTASYASKSSAGFN